MIEEFFSGGDRKTHIKDEPRLAFFALSRDDTQPAREQTVDDKSHGTDLFFHQIVAVLRPEFFMFFPFLCLCRREILRRQWGIVFAMDIISAS